MTKRALLCISALSILPFAAMAEQAGSVVTTEGTVFVVRADGKRKIVSAGSALEKGDTVQTERDSTAKLRFSDGGEMVLRPASTMVIQDYSFQESKPEKDSLVIGLLRGGLRQLTGFIGKRGNQDAYRLNGGTATIGIRGTDFTARVCSDTECKQGGEAKQKLAASSPIIAKLVEFKGKVFAVQSNGVKRELWQDAPLYQSELVETESGGYAALLFVDQSRIVIPSESSLRLSSYRYVKDQPEKSNAFFEMVKGGFRMVSGLLGKQAPKNVAISTGTATIGIRGTSFDLACVEGNVTDADKRFGASEDVGQGGTKCGAGLLTFTREGAISLTTQDGRSTVFSAGQSSYLAGAEQSPSLLSAPVNAFDKQSPVPDLIKPDMDKAFGSDGSAMGDAGLYVTVTEGKVIIGQAGKEIPLGAGESGFASGVGQMLMRLNTPPVFLSRDRSVTQQIVGFGTCRR